MIRRARMQGKPTLWLPGVDHASIAAQLVLDKIIAAEGESRDSLGRERYLQRMWQFMDETRGVISGQHRRLGVSVDWGRERFTMDEGSARAVRVAFKRLYDDGLAYRGEKLINWCPGCRTSLSDLEVIATPEHGSSGSCATTCCAPTARPTRTRRSPWRRRAPRRSSATPRWPCTPTMPATRPRRPAGARPVRRARHPDHRRHDGRSRVRHRRRQDHARARPRGLRDRPAPWPADRST